MGETMPYAKHDVEIKSLYEKDKAANKRIDDMGDLREVMHNLDKKYGFTNPDDAAHGRTE